MRQIASTSKKALSPGDALMGTVVMPLLDGLFCCIGYPDRSRYNTTGSSLFDAAVKALKWVEVERQSFGTARSFHDDDVLMIGVGMVPDRWYRVRIGRIRRWIRESGVLAARGNRRWRRWKHRRFTFSGCWTTVNL